ncbi:MAG TPA: NAD(P)/FAD-dependent oxidoreductase [Rhodocyclaceae bacterium]|nr:NAD(P)/FAD-dependent oxidoreductase [Rhodocyclaceae bacterium]HNC61908.1 NAD(P)/FAD-dependent oxidoreductase [Rhodocyclaceae bacterium]HNH13127.1 NAD(P)/FAD-dependent oxidoreductase [Rhodocyclaceae bacterium]
MQTAGQEAELTDTSTATDCDILVIGGGPAGSTAATLLARRGWKVVLLEKSHHPRFHIGESLLPANLPLLETLGVADEVKQIGMMKWGAEFVSPWHDHTSTFHFADAWDKSMPYAYQVRRSQFDEILFRNAARNGAQAIEGARVREVDFAPGGQGATVRAEHDDGTVHTWRCRFLVDASGRDTFLANRFKTKQRHPRHNSSAMYAHFAGATRHDGRDEGNISIFWFEHGWFWFIPLSDGLTSIGAVTWPYYMKRRDKPLREYFLDTIAQCPKLIARLAGASIASEVEATGNYSYVNAHTHGPDYLLLGDAYAFIDPVFSSGVMLAMQSAFTGADTVDACLREPARAPQALAAFDRAMRHGPKEFSWFIFRVTNPTMRHLFMNPRNTLRMKEALLSILAGDIFRDTPYKPALYAFRTLYYVFSAANLRRTIGAWRARRNNIRVDDAGAGAAP